MKLLIISHTPHYRYQNKAHGEIRGWGPTVREIDHLASLFDSVVHLAPLYDEPTPNSALPYTATNVQLEAVRPVGGPHLRDKLRIVRSIPAYGWAILRAAHNVDVIHVRCPANISLIALLLMLFPFLMPHRARRWVKYAGNWKPGRRDAVSYTLQRWLLNNSWAAKLHRAKVTVNGTWHKQPDHVISFLNPCLTDEELAEGSQHVAQRTPWDRKRPLQLIFVGALNTPKGVGRALEVVAKVLEQGIDVHFNVVGDGPERTAFEVQSSKLGIAQRVTFHGWLPRAAIAPLYGRADLMLFPTDSSEGWPKVISEGMAYGVVPLAGAVSSIPQLLDYFEVGRAIAPYDISEFSQSILWYTQNPDELYADAARGVKAARNFTYSYYVEQVRGLLGR